METQPAVWTQKPSLLTPCARRRWKRRLLEDDNIWDMLSTFLVEAPDIPIFLRLQFTLTQRQVQRAQLKHGQCLSVSGYRWSVVLFVCVCFWIALLEDETLRFFVQLSVAASIQNVFWFANGMIWAM